ncbi:hypothetical protein NA57DRAFT_80818 [Rhizodiscina lignyota]|uniref:Secreted protein n=1 Tax=Rhizodiscina lignyota TaxID=1504668 RepID=A0A9P4I2H1_9PEZI|nr:hypothetical protein NA57DRAFT_80818 [Rhizodiscina lignyota]
MGLKIVLSAAILAAAPAVAFTNGTLVPAYICNPVADGMPKTFGQLLQLTREQTPTVAFNQNKGQDVQAPLLPQQGNGQNQIGNSAYILASLHDSPNNLNTQQQSVLVKPANGNSIVAGQVNKLQISSSDNSQLKGVLLYGQDGTGTRQGSFTDAQNGPFVPFPGCGKNPQGQISGVIQQTGVSKGSTYSNLVYNAPSCVQDNNITIGGLSVTGSGFGVWSYSFTVTGSNCDGGNGGNGGSSNGGNGNAATGNTNSNQGAGTAGNTGNNGNAQTGSGNSNSGNGQNGSGNRNSGNNNVQNSQAATAGNNQTWSYGGNGKGQGQQNAATTLSKVAAQASGKPYGHK